MFWWLIAYIFAVLSAVLAGLYGFMSAEGAYGLTKACILAAVAFAGCHGIAFAGEHQERGRYGAAFVCYVGTLFCFIVTLWGGLGTMSAGSSGLSAERKKIAASIALDREKLKQLETERKTWHGRAVPVIRADLQTARSQAMYRSTSGCEPAQVSAHGQRARDFCDTYNRLEAELGVSQEMARKDDAITKTQERLREAPPELQADPQNAAFSALTGISIEVSAALYALAASISLELAAAMMMLKAHIPRSVERNSTDNRQSSDVHVTEFRAPREDLSGASSSHERIINGKHRPEQRQLSRPVPRMRPAPLADTRSAGERVTMRGRVSFYLAEHAVRADGERIKVRAVFDGYIQWCKQENCRPVELTKFFDALEAFGEENGNPITWDGPEAYCNGMLLKGQLAA